MADQVPFLIGTSHDGRLMGWLAPDNLIDVKEVGGLGHYRRLWYGGATQLEPTCLDINSDNTFVAIALPDNTILLFDLKVYDKETHECRPVARLKHHELIVSLAFSGTRTDDVVLFCKGISGTDRAWNLTRYLDANRKSGTL